MYTILISLAVGILVGSWTARDLASTGWGVFCAVVAMLIVQLVIGLIVRKKVNRLNQGLQEIMQQAQAKISRLVQQYQVRPPGNLRLAQQSLERMQTDAIRETLAGTDAFRPLYRWNWVLRKQINTMKMQLYFQLKENDKVDALLPKCFLMDSRSLAIKLVRMFKNGDPGLDKFYDKKCRKLKGEDGAFVALTYAWIKLRQDQPEPARSALVAARKSSDNPVLKENYERLVNGKFKQFSNSGLGDAWYALYLEEPKIKPQRVQQQRMY